MKKIILLLLIFIMLLLNLFSNSKNLGEEKKIINGSKYIEKKK